MADPNPVEDQAVLAAQTDAFNDASYVSPKRLSVVQEEQGNGRAASRGSSRSASLGRDRNEPTPPRYTNRVDGSVLGFRFDRSKEVQRTHVFFMTESGFGAPHPTWPPACLGAGE